MFPITTTSLSNISWSFCMQPTTYGPYVVAFQAQIVKNEYNMSVQTMVYSLKRVFATVAMMKVKQTIMKIKVSASTIILYKVIRCLALDLITRKNDMNLAHETTTMQTCKQTKVCLLGPVGSKSFAQHPQKYIIQTKFTTAFRQSIKDH